MAKQDMPAQLRSCFMRPVSSDTRRFTIGWLSSCLVCDLECRRGPARPAGAAAQPLQGAGESRHIALYNRLLFLVTLSVISIADVGKRDLPAQLRNRFTEVWVGEPGAREELAAIAAAYLADAVPNPPVDAIVDFYLAAKAEAVRQAA